MTFEEWWHNDSCDGTFVCDHCHKEHETAYDDSLCAWNEAKADERAKQEVKCVRLVEACEKHLIDCETRNGKGGRLLRDALKSVKEKS